MRGAATDVFLLEDQQPRIRREGKVTELHPGLIPRFAIQSLWKSCGVDPNTNKEADVSWQLAAGKRMRVNLYHTLGRLAAVMRPIREDIPSLQKLEMPFELLESWMIRTNGLVLAACRT